MLLFIYFGVQELRKTSGRWEFKKNLAFGTPKRVFGHEQVKTLALKLCLPSLSHLGVFWCEGLGHHVDCQSCQRSLNFSAKHYNIGRVLRSRPFPSRPSFLDPRIHGPDHEHSKIVLTTPKSRVGEMIVIVTTPFLQNLMSSSKHKSKSQRATL